MFNHIMKMFMQLTITLTFISCAKAPMEDIKTRSIHASFKAIQDESGNVSCRAVFQVGNSLGTYIELGSDGTVTCNGTPMHKSELVGMIEYSADVRAEEDNQYEIVFERTDDEPGIFTALAEIPSAPEITYPTPNAMIEKQSHYKVQWTPMAGMEAYICLKVFYSGPGHAEEEMECSNQSPEVGEMTLTPDFILHPGQETAYFSIKRTKNGKHPNGLKGDTSGKSNSKVEFYLVD